MKARILLAAFATLLVVHTPASAQMQKPQMQKPMKLMTMEERQAVWASLSDEEKQRIVQLRAKRQQEAQRDAATENEAAEMVAGGVYTLPTETGIKPISDMKNPGAAPTYVDLNKEVRKIRDQSYNR